MSNVFAIIPNVVNKEHRLYNYYNGIYITYRYIKIVRSSVTVHYVYEDNPNSIVYKFIVKLVKDLKSINLNNYDVIVGLSNLLIINTGKDNIKISNITTSETNIIQENSQRILNKEVVFLTNYQNNSRFNPIESMDGNMICKYDYLFTYDIDSMNEILSDITMHIDSKIIEKNLSSFLNDLNTISKSIMNDKLSMEFKKMERVLKLESLNMF